MIYVYYKFTESDITYKKQHETGMLMLKKIINNLIGATTNVKIEKKDNGKPYVKDSKILFNISHTAGCVMCCVYAPDNYCKLDDGFGDLSVQEKIVALEINNVKDVGCDIEKIPDSEEKRNIFSISKRFFSENEQKFITSAHDKNKAFYEVWTRNESYLKCTGEGIGGMKKTDTFNLPSTVKIYPYIINSGESYYSSSICVDFNN